MTASPPRRRLRAVGATLALSLCASTAAAAPAQAGLLDGVLGTTTNLLSTTTRLLGELTAPLLGDDDWQYTATATSVRDAAIAVRADVLWKNGITGRGVGVALIDTGVVPVQGLTSGNVVNGPDLSFESQSPEAVHLDTFGHGTHMAGLIAGRDSTSGSGYRGLAPDSTLISVKVGAQDGAVDVSQVIAAVDWVVQNRASHNIRVLNLSYGTDSTQVYTSDPLAHAVENAWRAGIVVVVSGGNSGAEQPRVDSPATDPYVLAVGADDILGTTKAGDDRVPPFSTRGGPARRVDLVAPGQSLLSLRNPGSYVDTHHPEAVVDERFFKGSGTSQAAAVVSGSAALLLQHRPHLTPDQVKTLLVSTATRLPEADAAGQGAGLVNLYAAATTAPPATVQTHPASTGLGSLEAARGSAHVSDEGVELAGEQDIFGIAWDPTSWAPRSAAGTAWTGGSWNGSAWTGDCFCGDSWTGSSWTGKSWTGKSWTGKSWTGKSWTGSSWTGKSWTGKSWTGKSWTGKSWTGSTWSSGPGPVPTS